MAVGRESPLPIFSITGLAVAFVIGLSLWFANTPDNYSLYVNANERCSFLTEYDAYDDLGNRVMQKSAGAVMPNPVIKGKLYCDDGSIFDYKTGRRLQ